MLVWKARLGNFATVNIVSEIDMEKLIVKGWKLLKDLIEFWVFQVLHLRISDEAWKHFLQFAKFSIIGLSNTVISYIIYIVVLIFLQRNDWFENIDYLLGQLAGFIISVLWSFYWNRKYVFDAANASVSWPQALLKTYISYAFTGIFLNSVLSILWVEVLEIPKLVAPIINLLVSVPLNFILNKFWAFRKK